MNNNTLLKAIANRANTLMHEKQYDAADMLLKFLSLYDWDWKTVNAELKIKLVDSVCDILLGEKCPVYIINHLDAELMKEGQKFSKDKCALLCTNIMNGASFNPDFQYSPIIGKVLNSMMNAIIRHYTL